MDVNSIEIVPSKPDSYYRIALFTPDGRLIYCKNKVAGNIQVKVDTWSVYLVSILFENGVAEKKVVAFY